MLVTICLVVIEADEKNELIQVEENSGDNVTSSYK